MKYLLTVLTVALTLFAVNCYADMTVDKIDDTTAKVVVTNVTEKDGVKSTLTQEKNFTISELKQSISQADNAIQSIDKSIEEANTKKAEVISYKNAQQQILDEMIKQGIKDIEPVKDVIAVEPN